jgi:uncharacterized protein YacL
LLKALSVSNGAYYATYRVMEISTSHILPTMVLIIVVIVLLVLGYFVFRVFIKTRENLVEYIKN